MTKLLEETINRLRELPEDLQDMAARQLIRQLEEEPEPGDLDAIDAGRRDFKEGSYVTLAQLRHDMGLGDR